MRFEGKITRKHIRYVLAKLYNNRSILTKVSTNDNFVSTGKAYACLDKFDINVKEEEIPYHIAYQIIEQHLVELRDGNDYCGEENYMAHNDNIIKLVPIIKYDIGDTVRCCSSRNDNLWLSGFITNWAIEHLDTLYINGTGISPSKVFLIRKVLIEKVNSKKLALGGGKNLPIY